MSPLEANTVVPFASAAATAAFMASRSVELKMLVSSSQLPRLMLQTAPGKWWAANEKAAS